MPYKIHIVKKGETLSDILFNLNISPLWGKKGLVRKTWEMNREAVEREGSLIYPGTEIRIPLSEVSTVEVKPSGPREPASEKPDALPSEAPVPSPSSPPSPPPTIDVPGQSGVKGSHEIQVGLGYAFSSLSASDTTSGGSAKLLSSHDVNFHATWAQPWSESFSTFFRLDLRSIGFEANSGSSKTLDDSSHTPAHFSLGAENALGSRFSIRYFLSYGDELFTQGLNSTTVGVDSVPLVSGTAVIDAKIYEKKPFLLGAQFSASYFGSGASETYDVKAGSGLSGSVYVERTLGASHSKTLRLEMGYEERTQNTSIIRQTENSIFSGLTLFFPLDGEP